jgi:hypothetical protein
MSFDVVGCDDASSETMPGIPDRESLLAAVDYHPRNVAVSPHSLRSVQKGCSKHPTFIRSRRDPRDVHNPVGKANHKQHVVRDQTAQRLHDRIFGRIPDCGITARTH